MAKRRAARSFWLEVKVGDSVYLDHRLKFRSGRWKVLRIDDEGFMKIQSLMDAADKRFVRADCVTGWFAGFDRVNRAPTPIGKMTAGPQSKKQGQRSDRLIDLE